MTRYAIIEDNNYALKHLRMEVERLRPDWEIVFTGKSISDTINFLKSDTEVNLIFMDVELSDGECFEIFDAVDTDVPVIFTTAYKDFAVKAFKVNSIGYIIKPVSHQELESAISKYEYFKQRLIADTLQSSPIESSSPQPASRILTVNGDRYDYINITDIIYFESEDSYVFAKLKDGSRRLINQPNLTKLEEVLNSDTFFRVSRDMIISIGCIRRVGKHFRGRLLVTIHDSTAEKSISVSSTKREAFLKWLGR